MSGWTKTEVRPMVNYEYDKHHDERIRLFYADARDRHPYFCDMAGQFTTKDFRKKMEAELRKIKSDIKLNSKTGELEWIELLECKKFGAVCAMAKGDWEAAVEKLYEEIAICLRQIDVLEKRQKIGNPDKKQGKGE